jgi:hypothetical protein
MNSQQQKTIDDMLALMSSPEFIEKEKKRFKMERILKDKHISKIKSFYSSPEEFQDFTNYNILRHNSVWDQKCYDLGYQPYNKKSMNILFDIAFNEGTTETIELDEFTTTFPSRVCEYYGFYFVYVYGQGTVSCIYNLNKECIYST